MRIKDIPGFEGLYVVTDGGDVMSIYRQYTDKIGRLMFKASRVLSAAPDNRGYRIVHLYDRDGGSAAKSVHRLVAEAFIDGMSEQVNHIDGNRGNNNVSNLEWCTASANQFHRHSRKRHVKLSATQIIEVREQYGKIPTKVLAEKYDVDRSTIYMLAHGGRHKNGRLEAERRA